MLNPPTSCRQPLCSTVAAWSRRVSTRPLCCFFRFWSWCPAARPRSLRSPGYARRAWCCRRGEGASALPSRSPPCCSGCLLLLGRHLGLVVGHPVAQLGGRGPAHRPVCRRAGARRCRRLGRSAAAADLPADRGVGARLGAWQRASSRQAGSSARSSPTTRTGRQGSTRRRSRLRSSFCRRAPCWLSLGQTIFAAYCSPPRRPRRFTRSPGRRRKRC